MATDLGMLSIFRNFILLLYIIILAMKPSQIMVKEAQEDPT